MDGSPFEFLFSMSRSLLGRLSRSFRNQRPGDNVGLFIWLWAILAIQLPVEAQQSPLDANDQVTLAIIVVSSQDKARQVLDQLQPGADFGALAKKLSIDSTADQGGFMGQVSRANLRPELRDAVRNLHPGQLSSIVRVPLGFAIVKVLENQVITGMGVPVLTQGSSAAGSVKYTFGVSGQSESNLLLLKMARDPDWNPEPHMLCDLHRESVSTATETLKDLLTKEQSSGAPANSDTMNAHFTLAQVDAYQGDMQGSVEEFERAYNLAKSIAPDFVLPLHEALGISYLHKSEMDNEVYRKPGEKCLLPMLSRNKYEKTDDSEKAVEHFLQYLEQKPDEIEVKWLLNYAYMTLGAYPDKVPAKYLIPVADFQSAEDIGRFEDVAPQAGLNAFSMAAGVIVDDFENNGRYDVVKSSYDSCAPMEYFHNNGDGTFTEQAAKAGLADQLGALNIIQTDFNNDGCLDILMLRGGWEVPQRKTLLKNNCDGTFTDVTATSGLAEHATSTQAAVWVDINNDGLLDLFVGNENSPSQLFLNKGNGVFQDISHSSGVDRIAFSKGVVAADYDNDGWPDLFVSNLNGPNFLYHNNHDNTFTEVAEEAGVQGPTRGFSAWFFDYDNDGWPDLFVTSYFGSVEETARTYLGLAHNATTLKLFKNMRNGKFRDVTAEVGLDKVFMPMGANFGDIDNDGFLDIYLGTGNPSYASVLPNVLLHNKDGKKFVDITSSSGTGDWHKGHGVAFADMDNRGFEDIVTVIGGATPGDAHAMRLFENPGNRNDWISVKLIGVKSNRAAIGARIKLTVENSGQAIRSIYRTVGSGGSFGASPLEQHIGLGRDARIVDLEIWWPTSNTRQHFANVDKNQFLEIKEFAQNYTKLERPPVRLGGAKR
jgi:tetratricopeptide (TPR) repeat protein